MALAAITATITRMYRSWLRFSNAGGVAMLTNACRLDHWDMLAISIDTVCFLPQPSLFKRMLVHF